MAASICDINEKKLAAVTDSVDVSYRSRILTQPVDVADRGAIKSFLEGTKRHFGRVDGIANIAGIGGRLIGTHPIWEIPTAEYDLVMDANARSVFNTLAEGLVPGFMETPGSIVNVGSMYSVRGFKNAAPYCGSKHAMIGLTKTAAIEAGEGGIRVNALLPNVTFVKCDVTSFESQLQMFKAAKENSPSHTIDVVVACAGIAPNDTVFNVEQDGDDDPVAPNMLMMNVNVTGVLYSQKLARHYFLRNPIGADRDRCFVIFSSAAGYLDLPEGPCTKRRNMRFAVSCAPREGRPRFVSTGLLSADVQDHVKGQGVKFADAGSAAELVLRIAATPSINGRSFAVVPSDEDAPRGYIDQDLDDYEPGSRAGSFTMASYNARD
ncbi:unnamed protein product [Parascedosporium putredinis]|uniref:Uncharacterized protein n=1 Tax=Parascedosporium putredinis TaxID=1442378 RepID=A0A9P1MC13_9PEZI|nr:unnamed protein product [Parascedosporium putredinis]CAI7996827.1 unnamed protein product [Parascedosporium putredinis]